MAWAHAVDFSIEVNIPDSPVLDVSAQERTLAAALFEAVFSHAPDSVRSDVVLEISNRPTKRATVALDEVNVLGLTSEQTGTRTLQVEAIAQPGGADSLAKATEIQSLIESEAVFKREVMQLLPNATSGSAAWSINVQGVGNVEQVQVTVASDEDSLSVGERLAILGGGVALLLCCCCAFVLLSRRRGKEARGSNRPSERSPTTPCDGYVWKDIHAEQQAV